jgi:hypothetical protein
MLGIHVDGEMWIVALGGGGDASCRVDAMVNLPNRRVRRSKLGIVIRLGLVYIMMRNVGMK